jgi:hypothetical protein
MLVVILFLQQQVRASREEGMWWVLGGDDRNSMAELGVEATKHVEHLACLPDRLPDVAQSVGKLFEATGVGGDVHISLNETAELSFEVNGTVQLVVPELLGDGGPDDVGGGARNTDEGTDILGHRVVQPTEDALVAHDPLAITAVLGSWPGGEMRTEAKLSDERIKEGTPFGVVGVNEIKLDGNVRFDVDSLEDGRRGHSDGGRNIIDGGSEGVFGASIRGVGDIVEWVGLHIEIHGDEKRRA